MPSPRMTKKEILDEMRKYGMSISDSILYEGIKQGVFPFGKYVEAFDTSAYIIMRKDFEDWAAEYLIPYSGGN